MTSETPACHVGVPSPGPLRPVGTLVVATLWRRRAAVGAVSSSRVRRGPWTRAGVSVARLAVSRLSVCVCARARACVCECVCVHVSVSLDMDMMSRPAGGLASARALLLLLTLTGETLAFIALPSAELLRLPPLLVFFALLTQGGVNCGCHYHTTHKVWTVP